MERCLEVELPPGVRACVDAIARAGGRSLLVGGGVRDRLLGLSSGDWDIATDMRPERLAGLLPATPDVDPAIGRVAVVVDGREVVFTTLRAESDYGPDRRPRRVTFVDTPEADAPRRDFTINAIYVDLADGRIVDPCGGIEDLSSRRLRFIGDPDSRLHEDPLRAFRAARFAARYDLTLDADAADAIRRADVSGLSAERVRVECTAMWTGVGRGRALDLGEDLLLFESHLPQRARPGGGAVLDALPAGRPGLSWAVVLESADPDDLRSLLRDLAFPRGLRDEIVDLVTRGTEFSRDVDGGPAAWGSWLRDGRREVFCDYELARRVVQERDSGPIIAFRAAANALPTSSLISGRDVVDLGVPMGPMVGDVLDQARAIVDTRGIQERELALAVLREVARKAVKER